jgi:alkylation response protein AidB-like acyl-CoA dehydrogenase
MGQQRLDGPGLGCLHGTPTIAPVQRHLFDADHEEFRARFARFVASEIVPHHPRWEREGIVDRAMFAAAGRAGFLGMAAPVDLGGAGVADFRYNVVISEELARAGVVSSGFCIWLHNDVCLPYFLAASEEQQRRWLPGICSGSSMTAIAMTEPSMGSDLAAMSTTALRDGDHYVVNGSKTFITNGINASLCIVAVKTDPTQRHRGISLLVVEDGTPGFERGRNLDKVGLHAQDTAELFFHDCRVPVANRLGEEGTGFFQLVDKLPQERLSMAVLAVAHARQTLAWTLEQLLARARHGRPVDQHDRFALAEMHTELELAQCHVDRCVLALNDGTLTAEEAAAAKWWCTELQARVADRCLQLHGEAGYLADHPVARAYLDARVQRIYGGTTEIMKEIVGRSLGV